MQIIERGHGDPLVLIPGIQGRWEWVRDTVDALAGHYRVLTFSLGDEPSAGCGALRPGIDGFADQIDTALQSRGLRRAVIVGISFGGLVALRFAARSPDRVSALILASAPGPGWHMRPEHERYSQFPFLFAPLFALGALRRMLQELGATFSNARETVRFLIHWATTPLMAPGSPRRMAERARLIASHDRAADAAAVAAPTLILHGDPALDYVVDVDGTREYAQLIRRAQTVQLERTGHLGFSTRPAEFAQLVRQFLERATQGTHDSAA